MNEVFSLWMQQPGKVKKLQALLLISVLLNIFLLMQLGLHKQKPSKKLEEAVVVQQEAVEAKQSKITEDQLREFCQSFIENFFTSSEEALNNVKTFSSESLFEKTIRKELEARIEQKINSKFKLDDMFLDSISASQAKAIVLGREVFVDGDYENRNITIELVIDTEKLVVTAIPVFKVDS